MVADADALNRNPMLEQTAARSTADLILRREAKVPDADSVEEAANSWRARGIAAVIAIGGGSTIDFVKAVAAVIAEPGVLRSESGAGFVFASATSWPALPIVAVPTTPGTGTEVNGKAIVMVRDKRKMLVAWATTPLLAILDGFVYETLPERLLLDGGLETLARLGVPLVTAASTLPIADHLGSAQIASIDAVVGALETGDRSPARLLELALCTSVSVMALHQFGRGLHSYWLWYLVNELMGSGLSKGDALRWLLPSWLRMVREGSLPGGGRVHLLGDAGSTLSELPAPRKRIDESALQLATRTWAAWGEFLSMTGVAELDVCNLFIASGACAR